MSHRTATSPIEANLEKTWRKRSRAELLIERHNANLSQPMDNGEQLCKTCNTLNQTCGFPVEHGVQLKTCSNCRERKRLKRQAQNVKESEPKRVLPKRAVNQQSTGCVMASGIMHRQSTGYVMPSSSPPVESGFEAELSNTFLPIFEDHEMASGGSSAEEYR